MTYLKEYGFLAVHLTLVEPKAKLKVSSVASIQEIPELQPPLRLVVAVVAVVAAVRLILALGVGTLKGLVLAPGNLFTTRGTRVKSLLK